MESKLAEHEKACEVNSTDESHYDLNILKEGKTKFTDCWNTVFAKQCILPVFVCIGIHEYSGVTINMSRDIFRIKGFSKGITP